MEIYQAFEEGQRVSVDFPTNFDLKVGVVEGMTGTVIEGGGAIIKIALDDWRNPEAPLFDSSRMMLAACLKHINTQKIES